MCLGVCEHTQTPKHPWAKGWVCVGQLDVLIWYSLDNFLCLFWLQMTPEESVRLHGARTQQGDTSQRR